MENICWFPSWRFLQNYTIYTKSGIWPPENYLHRYYAQTYQGSFLKKKDQVQKSISPVRNYKNTAIPAKRDVPHARSMARLSYEVALSCLFVSLVVGWFVCLSSGSLCSPVPFPTRTPSLHAIPQIRGHKAATPPHTHGPSTVRVSQYFRYLDKSWALSPLPAGFDTTVPRDCYTSRTSWN